MIQDLINNINLSNTKLYNELKPFNVIKIIVSPLRTKFTKHASMHNCLLMYNDDDCIMVNLISYDIVTFFNHLLNDTDRKYIDINLDEFQSYNIGNFYQIEETYKSDDACKHEQVLEEVTCEPLMRMFTRINRINE